MNGTTANGFELRVEPVEDAAYRLALWQHPVRKNGNGLVEPRQLATLKGTPLHVALDQVLDALKRNDHLPTALRATRQDPIPLNEETGVRLGLLFLALRPLEKVNRMERVAAGIRSMPSEETYYWFSKCARGRAGSQAQRALRILLAGA
jgi:hypothetical protein